MKRFIFILLGIIAVQCSKHVDDYYISSVPLSWREAIRYCEFHGMQLIDLPTVEDGNKIRALIRSSDLGISWFWTSGTNTGHGGSVTDYFWVTNGVTISNGGWYYKFLPHQGQNAWECIYLYAIYEELRSWRCTDAAHFVCIKRRQF